MAIQYIDSFDWNDKWGIARFDFNVPLKNGNIIDTTRIDMAIPTIKHLLEGGVKKLILMSHLGRPKGEVKKELSLEPIASYLAEKLEQEVILSQSAVGIGLKELLNLSTTKIVLLENLRFHPEETNNSNDFARELSQYAGFYINDAFGTAHREHASTYGIIEFFPRKSFAGFLIKSEIEALDKIQQKPTKPFVAVVGGAKVSDKIKTLERFLINSDHLLIGGAMAYPFLKAKGIEIGKSLCSDDDVLLAKDLLLQDRGGKIKLPVDHLVAKSPDDSQAEHVTSIEGDLMGLDIGEQTRANYIQLIQSAKTIFWNGPMGFFEKEVFAKGTLDIAKAIGASDSYSVVGGGDSVAAVKQMKLEGEFSHVSTGGGASLKYIESGQLPGIKALRFGI